MTKNKHPLLIYEQLSQRFRTKLLLVWIFLLGVLIINLIVPFLGLFVVALWVSIPAVMLWWGYYAFVVPKAWIEVKGKHLLVKLPMQEIRISYGRIDNIIATKMSEHFGFDELNGREQAILAPYFKQTCALMKLTSIPAKLNKKNAPWYFFSPHHKGVLLIVPNWMRLSRQIETARTKWQERQGINVRNEDETRSLAARILDL
ncbi:MAG: hypothetical protein AAF490_27690 [Chloroflexota bacterium]